jgi:hypothetical protein
VLAIFNVSEIRDLDLIEQHGFDEFWNNNGALWFRPHMLCNDKCEMFHWLTFTLGLKGKCVIRYVNEDDTSITITKVLVWCCTPTLPSCEVCYKTIANFD